MIPRLYGAKEKDFGHNGIGLLVDTISCLVTEEQNGYYELELTYIVGSFLCQLLVEDNIIKAKANEEHDPQLFRIYYVSEEINGTIQVKAEHISYDLRGNFIENIMLAGVTCQEAGQQMLSKLEEPHNFTFSSDIEMTGNYNVTRYNGLESIAGSRGSLLDTFGNGAKLIRDNFNISLNKTRGKSNNVLISYAKNLIGYKRQVDCTDIITKIYPYAIVRKNIGTEEDPQEIEETIVLPERFINSLNYDKYAHGKIVSVDYSSNETVKDIASLRSVASKFFNETKQDEPNINYQVEFINLYGTSEYDSLNLRALEKICMDDTVIVRDFRFGRNIEARVIKTVYNSLLERYEKIELGKFRESLKLNNPDLEEKVDIATNQIKNIYTRFQVMDGKIQSEVAKLEGDIKTSTSLWKQEANKITSTVTDLSGKYSELKQTVDGFDFTGLVTFYDLKNAGSTIINGSNITTGSINGNRISGGVIEGTELKTSSPTSYGGMWIRDNGMQLGATSLMYAGTRFTIESPHNIGISTNANIFLMPSSYVNIDGRCNASSYTLGDGESAYIKYGSFYSPFSGSYLSTYATKLNGVILVGTSSGNLHVITSGGSKGGLYANVYSSYSLDSVDTISINEEENALDIIDKATVSNNFVIPKSINYPDFIKLNDTNTNTNMDDYVSINKETNTLDMNINNIVALLWKSIQELKQENNILKTEISTLKGGI